MVNQTKKTSNIGVSGSDCDRIVYPENVQF